MADDYLIKIVLDDEKTGKLAGAGLDSLIAEESGKKLIQVALLQKNQRKFRKAFKDAVLNARTGEVDNFPQEAADLLFDVVIENKSTEVMHLFLMKAFKPLAGKELRQAIH